MTGNEKSKLHNRLSQQILFLLGEAIQQDMKVTEMLVIWESVTLGVVLATVKLGGDEAILDEMMKHVKERLALARLGNIETKGQG